MSADGGPPIVLLNYTFVAVVFSLLLGATVSQEAVEIGRPRWPVTGIGRSPCLAGSRSPACVGTKLLRT